MKTYGKELVFYCFTIYLIHSELKATWLNQYRLYYKYPAS